MKNGNSLIKAHHLHTSPIKPMNLKEFRKTYKLNSSNFLTLTNPKVLKSDKIAPTAVLMLKPTALACPAAGTCRKICLNTAGNPVYLKNKLACRTRRDKALRENTNAFYNMLIVELLRFYSKHREHEQLGARLNGVSDYAFEKDFIDPLYSIPSTVNVTAETVATVKKQFNISIYQGKINIIEAILCALDDETGHKIGRKLRFYDYTKRIDRDFKQCKALDYHLTLSHGSKFDTFSKALELGLNYAAAFTDKLPETFTYKGHRLTVLNGDLTDWRPADNSECTNIVGLVMKRTPGETDDDRQAFCINGITAKELVRA